MAMDPKELLEAIKAQLAAAGVKWDKLSDEMAPLMKEQSRMLNELKSRDDDRLKEIDAKLQEYGPKLQDVQEEHRALRKAVAELEKKNQRSFPQDDRRESIGAEFVKSPSFTGWLGRKKIGSADPFVSGSSFFERKASFDFDESNNALGIVQPMQRDLVEFRKLTPVHRDILTIVPVEEANSVVYAREKYEYMLVARVTAQALTAQKVVYVDSVSGMSTSSPFNAFTCGNNTGTIASIDADNLKLTMTDNLTEQIEPGAKLVMANFVPVAEGHVAVRSLDVTEEVTAAIEEISTYLTVTERLLDDAPRTQDTVDRRLRSRVARTESKNVWYGPGGSGQIEGFFTNASILEVKWSTQAAGTTKLDLLQYAISLVAAAEGETDYIVIAPSDFFDIMRIKGNDGHYVFSQVQTVGMSPRVWTAQLVPTGALDSGDAIAGDFSLGATLFDRMQTSIVIGRNNDDLTRRKFTMVGTLRVGLAIDIPAYFIKIDFDSKP
jgi:hypothetical protein